MTLLVAMLALVAPLSDGRMQPSMSTSQTVVEVRDEGESTAKAVTDALPGYSAASIEDAGGGLSRIIRIYDPMGRIAAEINLVGGRIVSVHTQDGSFPRPRDIGQLVGWIANGNTDTQY